MSEKVAMLAPREDDQASNRAAEKAARKQAKAERKSKANDSRPRGDESNSDAGPLPGFSGY